MGSTRAASDTTRSSVADARSTAPTNRRHSSWDRPGAEEWREWKHKKRKKQHRAGEKSKPIEWRHKGERHRKDKRGPGRTPDTGNPAPTTAAPAPSQPAPSTTSGGSANTSVVQQVVALVNKERAAAGCSPVTVNDALTRAAQKHSDAMAASGRLSHTGADGSTMASRVEAEGYNWSTIGENIAQGQRTPEEVMADWMSSPGHRENILNCSFKEIGVGVNMGSGGPWWTQDFGSRR